MSGRYVIIAFLAYGPVSDDEVYGEWRTYEAAKAQADIWMRKAERLAGVGGEVAFEVKELHPKAGSRALAELWQQLEENSR